MDESDSYGLHDKVVVLTGAAGGFGRVLTEAFLAAGAKVAALDVSEQGLDQLAVLANGSSNLITRRTDIGNYADCEAATAEVQRKFSAVDVLINNGAMGMGVFRDDHMTNLVSLDEIDPDTWNRFAAVNFSGAWYMSKCVLPAMRTRGWGRVLTVTTSFFTMLRGGFHPYGPCKAGQEAMCAGLAQEFTGSGVTINVVVPGGPADTPMVPSQAPYERNKLVPPSAMCRPMLWLCSSAADDTTGNRYVAGEWDTGLPDRDAAAACAAPIGWPSLAQNPVWPGGKPDV